MEIRHRIMYQLDLSTVYNRSWYRSVFTSSEDPNSVKSRTGCVLKYGWMPITWFSRLQTEIVLSTTEAEYIALSAAAREVLPLR